MPRRRQTRERVTERREVANLQQRLKLLQQWIKTERAAMDLQDATAKRLAAARRRIRERCSPLEAAFAAADKREDEELSQLLND